MFLTSKMVVKRYTNRYDLNGVQILFKEWYLFQVVRVWFKEIDREDVPSWATIQCATLGSTDWKSKFSDHIK